jgi:hypothetical protein
MYMGSCLCGKVKYQISGELSNASHCHCTMCQKGHGAACGSYANALRTDFMFVQGEEFVESYRSSPSVTRTFCRVCGSNLQWMSEEKHRESVSIALGTLDSSFVPTSQKHIFVETKASWNMTADDYPQHSRSS